MTLSRLLIQASANALPLRSESVQCVVTSPPYWGLRQYAGEQTVAWPDGSTHPLGLEPTPELYVAHMVEVFREVRRVLRADGTLWLNLGDSYAASGMGGNPAESEFRKQATNVGSLIPGRKPPAGLKQKDLVGIPWMVAFALRADGWYLRSDIIWAKPNPMPESVTDRPTKAHEYLFLLSKSPRYFYDADAIREPMKQSSLDRISQETFDTQAGGEKDYGPDSNRSQRKTLENFKKRTDKQRGHSRRHAGFSDRWDAMDRADQIAGGANKRTVWNIATRPYPGAHFATFPEELVEPCILAGSSPQACGVCSAPWEREIEKGEPILQAWSANGAGQYDDALGEMRRTGLDEGSTLKHSVPRTTTGWRPTCAHEDSTGTSTILDPFNGSGTTGRVAIRHGRSYIGVDISREYLAEQSTKRIDRVQHVMGGMA